jgi:predicted glycoside hydrolase/deacetylase ChbG (UPF0249 family)
VTPTGYGRTMASRDAEGLLIVNADDWGGTRFQSDAILTCFEAGRVTSATAMMYMADSEESAERARAANLPTGLHLNLSEPFTGGAVPDEIRDRQARLARYFSVHERGRWLFNPLIASDVDQAIADQMERFVDLYGRMPTHVDGHAHIHLYPNVLLSRALPKGSKVRRSFTFASDERSWATRTRRHLVNATLSRRFESTDAFFSVDPDDRARMNGIGIDERLAMSRTRAVEAMAHPGDPGAYEFLMSDEWGRLVEDRPLGSFDEL